MEKLAPGWVALCFRIKGKDNASLQYFGDYSLMLGMENYVGGGRGGSIHTPPHTKEPSAVICPKTPDTVFLKNAEPSYER